VLTTDTALMGSAVRFSACDVAAEMDMWPPLVRSPTWSGELTPALAWSRGRVSDFGSGAA
jgi:hypothetical protein